MKNLLSGVRVLALSQFGSGPFGTLHLADLGAEVIKIEDPDSCGDVARTVPPYTESNDSLYFQSLNRNKRSMSLNLRQPAGKSVFHDLVRVSDAVFANLRGDQPEKLGLTYSYLQSINPRIVCCTLTGFGLKGPRRDEPGYDYLLQAYAGWMSLTGDPDGPPTKSGLSLVDFSGGAVAMIGLLAGVLDARRTGQGCDVDVSLLGTAISMLNYQAIWSLNRDYEAGRMRDSAHPTVVPGQMFETQDSYLLVFCAKEKFWHALAEILEAPELVADPRYASLADRYVNRETLIDKLKPRFRARTTKEWLACLRGRVPCAPVYGLREALADEQVQACEMLIDVEHPVFGTLRQVRTAITVPGSVEHRRPAPPMGADTDAMLRDVLHYSDDRIAALRKAGAFGR